MDMPNIGYVSARGEYYVSTTVTLAKAKYLRLVWGKPPRTIILRMTARVATRGQYQC